MSLRRSTLFLFAMLCLSCPAAIVVKPQVVISGSGQFTLQRLTETGWVNFTNVSNSISLDKQWLDSMTNQIKWWYIDCYVVGNQTIYWGTNANTLSGKQEVFSISGIAPGPMEQNYFRLLWKQPGMYYLQCSYFGTNNAWSPLSAVNSAQAKPLVHPVNQQFRSMTLTNTPPKLSIRIIDT